MSAAMASIIKDEAVRPRLATLGATPVGSTPKEFGAYLGSELKRWGDTLKPMNIVLD
jgi:tripartite-type tricarboxylate transporter receptor subunit TctC